MLELFPMIYCAWCYSRRRYLPATDEGSHSGRRPTSTDLWFPWSYQCYGNGPGHAYILSYTGICLYLIMKQNTEDSSTGLSDSSDDILCMRCGATTPVGYCPSTASFSVRPHFKNARQDRCQEYHNCFPFGELEETTRTSSYYMDEDYPARPKIKQSLPGWGDNCGSESSTLETDVCVWRYAPLVVHATQEEDTLCYWCAIIIVTVVCFAINNDDAPHRRVQNKNDQRLTIKNSLV